MRNLYIVFIVGFMMALVSCASKERRTVESDQALRVAVNLEHIDLGNHQSVQSALLKSHKFIIVDRGPGMSMVNQERAAQWGVGRAVFEPAKRGAIGGYQWGAGGIVTPVLTCEHRWGFWGPSDTCLASLSITSARSGEILASVSMKCGNKRPNWNKLVTELISDYPEFFVKHDPTGTRLKEENEQIEKGEADWSPEEYLP